MLGHPGDDLGSDLRLSSLVDAIMGEGTAEAHEAAEGALFADCVDAVGLDFS